MSRRLLSLNLLLALVSLACGLLIAREVRAPGYEPPGVRAARVVPVTPAEPRSRSLPPPPSAYAVVTSRSLFSPARSAPTEAAAVRSTTKPPPKLALSGVVVTEGGAIAYVENLDTRRVERYRVGDTVAGGTVEAIAPDHIVVVFAAQAVNVRLRDPSRPRPAAAQSPGAPGAAGGTVAASTPATTPAAPTAGPPDWSTVSQTIDREALNLPPNFPLTPVPIHPWMLRPDARRAQ